MTFSAQQIAYLVQGRVEGNPDIQVHSFGKIEEAKQGQLAFLANPKYEDHLYNTGASVVIVNDALELREPVAATLLRVPDAYSAFAILLTKYEEMQRQQLVGRQEPHFIDPSATVGDQVYIGAFVYVGKNANIGNGVKLYPQVFIGDGAIIEDGAILHPGVKIYHQCHVGAGATIHAGTVIGADGFGFAPQADGTYQKVPQIGNVIIEAGVEIGANTCIDRATIGSTIIRKGAKIDNLVQIAHNVEVGSHTVIAAQTGISGSTKIGQGVMIGGQAGLAGHLTVGDGAKINAQSGLGKSLKPGQSVTGSPASDFGPAMRGLAATRRFPELEKRIAALEKLLAEIRAESNG